MPSLAFLQESKLLKVAGEPLRALHELNNALSASEITRPEIPSNGVVIQEKAESHAMSLHDVRIRVSRST